MAGAPQFLSNPQGAYGYDVSSAHRGSQVIRKFHNASSGTVIPAGAAVVLATVSTDGTGVLLASTATTASALYMGVSLTSASTAQSTVLSSNAATSAWCDVCVSGIVENALISTAVVPGDLLVAASTLVGGMHIAAPATGTTGGYIAIAGIALTSGSTQSTAGSTVGFGTSARGRMLVRPSILQLSSG